MDENQEPVPVIDITGQTPPPKAIIPKIETVRWETPKVGPNELCWCGSGKKYKKCCRNQDKQEERQFLDGLSK